MFDWNNAFSVGIEEIDRQHQHLFEIGEEIHQLMADFQGQDRFDEISAAIEKLAQYTVFHFDTEEKLFAQYGYPEAEEHEKEHRTFINYLNSLDLEHIDSNQEVMIKDLLKFVALWIFKHINNSDFGYKEYLGSRMN